MQHQSVLLLIALVVAVAPIPAQGPTALRLRGSVTSEDGSPIGGARVRSEAIAGIGGGEFAGQREFETVADKKGQWSLLGITRGTWFFEVTAEHHVPHVVAIPVAMTQATVMPSVTWHPALTLQRDDQLGALGPALSEVVKQARTDRSGAVAALRRLAVDPSSAEALCAAGDVSLLLRDFSLARGLFTQASQLKPDWFRPFLGVASAALATKDYEAAATAYWRVRDTSPSRDLQQTMSAAVADLQRLTGLK